MKFQRLVSLLKTVVAEDDFNERIYQNKVYNVFLQYPREAGSKYFQFEGAKQFKTFKANHLAYIGG